MTLTHVFLLYLAFVGVLAIINERKIIADTNNKVGFGVTILIILLGLIIGYAIGLAIVSVLVWFAVKILIIIGITHIGSWTVAFSWDVVMTFVILFGVLKMFFGKIF